MTCACGSGYCDCKETCVCGTTPCSCIACNQLKKGEVCKQSGEKCLCTQSQKQGTDCECNPSGAACKDTNIENNPSLDVPTNAMGSGYNQSGHSPERDDSEQDSQSSLDQTISQLFMTDETDSPPDKNLEIKRLAEIPSPDLHPRGYIIPSVTFSECRDSGLVSVSAPNIPSSIGDVLSCKQLSPIAPSASPPSQFSVESDEKINHWRSAPDVSNTFFSEPILPIRSISNPPGTGLCPTSAENADNPTAYQRTDSSMSISSDAVPSSFLTTAAPPFGDNSSLFLPAAVSSPTSTPIPISPNAVSSSGNSPTPISQAEIPPSLSPDATELLDKLSPSDSSKDVEKVVKECFDELSAGKKSNNSPSME